MRLTRLLWLLFAFYLTFVGGASYYNTIFVVRVAHHALLTLILGGWLITRLRARRHAGLPYTGLEVPLLAFMAVVGINIVTALDPRMAFENAWFGLVHLTLFFMLADLIQRGRQRLLMEVVFFMATVAVLISLWEFAAWYFGLGIIPGTSIGWIHIDAGLIPPLNGLPRLFLAMSVSTLLAGYIAPLVTISLGWALTAARRDYRWILGGLAALLLLILLMTGSRGGLLGVGVALGAFTVFQLVRWPQLTQRIPARLIVGGAVVIGVAGALAFVLITLPRGDGGSNSGRLDMWRSAIAITADHPLTGVGYGLFGRAFRDYRDPLVVQDKLAHAHNLYLNTLSELGIVGMIVVVILGIVAARLAWQHYRSLTDRPRQLRLEAVFCALLGYGAHSLVEAFSITPIMFLVLALVAYAITPQPASRLSERTAGSRPLALLLLMLLIGWYIALFNFDRAQAHYMQAFGRSNAQEALADLEAAHASDPTLNLYPLARAYVLDVSDDPGAIAAYQQALLLEPTWDIGWNNLARRLAEQGQLAAALEAADHAYQINRNSAALTFRTELAEQLSATDSETLVEDYSRAITNDYIYLQILPLAPYWDQTPLRRQALEAFVALSPLEWQYRIWAAHDRSRLAGLVPAHPVSANDWWVTGQNALDTGDATSAVTAFARAAALAGSSGDYYVQLAQAQITAGLPAATVAVSLRRADFYGTFLEDTAALWRLTDPTQGVTAAARQRLNAIEFAAVMYGRPALFDFRMPAEAVTP